MNGDWYHDAHGQPITKEQWLALQRVPTQEQVLAEARYPEADPLDHDTAEYMAGHCPRCGAPTNRAGESLHEISVQQTIVLAIVGLTLGIVAGVILAALA